MTFRCPLWRSTNQQYLIVVVIVLHHTLWKNISKITFRSLQVSGTFCITLKISIYEVMMVPHVASNPVIVAYRAFTKRTCTDTYIM